MLSDLKHFLLIDRKTGDISHTKFWSNVGYAAMIYTFVYAVMYGSTVSETIWMLFGAIVIGNRTLLKLIYKGK